MVLTAAQNYAVKVIEMPREEAERLVEADIVSALGSKPGRLYDAVEAAFADRLGPDVHIEKIGL